MSDLLYIGVFFFFFLNLWVCFSIICWACRGLDVGLAVRCFALLQFFFLQILVEILVWAFLSFFFFNLRVFLLFFFFFEGVPFFF